MSSESYSASFRLIFLSFCLSVLVNLSSLELAGSLPGPFYCLPEAFLVHSEQKAPQVGLDRVGLKGHPGSMVFYEHLQCK